MKPHPLLDRGPLRTPGDLGLLILTLLALSPLCSCQDDVVLEHCENSLGSQTFNGNCNSAGVIRIKQTYIGYGCSPPPVNRTICVGLTERLRVNCNQLETCTIKADPLALSCERPPGSVVYIVYQCVPVAAGYSAYLTNQSASGQSVWLRTRAHSPEGDDIYRQACRITAQPPQVIRVDFLDLSHSENRTSGSPYCVYGPGFSVCAQQASERQTFEVDATSDSTFTLLFWSNNYTMTTTARVWIDIRAAVGSSSVTVVCGLLVLEDPSYIITPEPYDNESSIIYPTSHPGGQDTQGVTPQGSNMTFLVSVISGALGGVFLLGILATLLCVCVYKRSKKRQSSAASEGDPEQTVDDMEMPSVPTRGVDNVYMTGPGSTTVDDFAASDTYDQPNGVHTAVSQSVSVPDGFYDTPIDADMAYYGISQDGATGHPPQRSASLDPSLPVEHLCSEVMKGRVSAIGGDDGTSHLYEDIERPCKSSLAAPTSSEVPPDNTTDPPVYSQVNKPMKTTPKDAVTHSANGVLYQNTQHSGNGTANGVLYQKAQQSGNGTAGHGDVGMSAHSAISETDQARNENAQHIGAGLYDKPKSNNILYDDTLPAKRTGCHVSEAKTRDDEVAFVENDLYEPTAPQTRRE